MEHLLRSLRLFWRSERLLAEQQFRLRMHQVQFSLLAAFVAVLGLVMLSIAAFFALVPYWGHALAALAVGAADIVLAAALAVYALSLHTSKEAELIKEVRDSALADIEDDVHSFIRNPVGALLVAAFGPLLNAVARGFRSFKK
jgi:hypothetical protein